MKKIILTPLLLVFILGCSSFSNNRSASMSGSAGMLESSAVLKFIDIPVPAGFKLLPQESYSFESVGVRVGVLRYVGKATPEQVINFYREKMPLFSWNLLNVIEYGDRIMNFERENESCIIALKPKTWGGIAITVSLGPRAQQAPKKPNKTLK